MRDLAHTRELAVTYVSPTQLTATVPAGLANGTYTVELVNPDGQSASLADAIRVDGVAPTVDSFKINGGATSTTSRSVTLGLSASDLTDSAADLSARFSNDGATWTSWQAYATSASWELSTGDGLKRVYVVVRDAALNESTATSAVIDLDSSSGTDPGVSINNGALFTSQTAVTLGIRAAPGTTYMQVSNDGGFAGAAWEPFSSAKAWEVTSYGNYVIARVVYVRFKGLDGGISSTHQDDIILDPVAPTGSVAIAGSSGVQSMSATTRLRLSATDGESGVKSMRLSNDTDFLGSLWQPYATEAAWDLNGGRTVYAQFRDHAGNVSPTYSATEPYRAFCPVIVRQ
jgi:hypothetical protein